MSKCFCMTSCKFDEKNKQQTQNLLLKVDPRSTFSTTFFNLQETFLLCDKLIMQGEKCETTIQN